MNYRKWSYLNESIIVEKFVGDVDRDFVMNSDQDLVSKDNPNTNISLLSDLRQMTIEGMTHEEINELVENFGESIPEHQVVRYALVVPSNLSEDIAKIYNYTTEIRSERMHSDIFYSIDAAYNWLGIPMEIREEISKDLSSIS